MSSAEVGVRLSAFTASNAQGLRLRMHTPVGNRERKSIPEFGTQQWLFSRLNDFDLRTWAKSVACS